jgi:hypothetical protein
MKFTKFGKALLMSAVSVGLILGVSSCVQSYTVGFLYVTGVVTALSGNNGIISGFKIDHNTGFLTAINGLPVSSGGANPVRSVLLPDSRFLYVLNRGVNAEGNGNCTASDPCLNSNITQFAVGGNGILTPQETFYTRGENPVRLIVDPAGGFILALDQVDPRTQECELALGSSVTSCGDITVFQVEPLTGRLTVVQNAQVTSASGKAINDFPVPAGPIDFTFVSGYVLTLSGTPSTGDAVFPYAYNAGTGQLTLSQNSAQPLGIKQGQAIVNAGGVVYVLDNEPPSTAANLDPGISAPGAISQILPFTVGANGSLQAETGGVVPDDPTLANPIYLILESKGKFIYVANQGDNVQGQNSGSGITGYFNVNSPNYELKFIPGEPFGSGAGPQCLVEDPSDQYVYTANYNDATVSGRIVDPNSGVLNTMRVQGTYQLPGPATWCLVDGRTD